MPLRNSFASLQVVQPQRSLNFLSIFLRLSESRPTWELLSFHEINIPVAGISRRRDFVAGPLIEFQLFCGRLRGTEISPRVR